MRFLSFSTLFLHGITRPLAAVSLAILAPGSACAVTLMLTDDFSTYGDSLTTGETTNPSVYSWAVTNHVNGSDTVPITLSGVELAGRFPGHTHPRNWTAEADFVFTAGSQPLVANTEVAFDIVERHEFTEFDAVVDGRATPAAFVFTGSGRARIEFTETGINEYLNGGFQASRTYASLGWEPTDRISSFAFTGLHHDNGSIDRSYIGNLSVTAIPEPSFLGLTAVAIATLLLRRRR
jgi:hypothetical protein